MWILKNIINNVNFKNSNHLNLGLKQIEIDQAAVGHPNVKYFDIL